MIHINLSSLTILSLIIILIACKNSSEADNQDQDPVKTIGDDADPEIVAALPFSSRSFNMGTAGFIPRHYPEANNDD